MADLTPSDIAGLRASGTSLEASFQIGKNGVTDGVVEELRTHLKREPLVKVKLLKGAVGEEGDKKAVAQDLAERAGAFLVEVRGLTALYYMPRQRGRGRR